MLSFYFSPLTLQLKVAYNIYKLNFKRVKWGATEFAIEKETIGSDRV